MAAARCPGWFWRERRRDGGKGWGWLRVAGVQDGWVGGLVAARLPRRDHVRRVAAAGGAQAEAVVEASEGKKGSACATLKQLRVVRVTAKCHVWQGSVWSLFYFSVGQFPPHSSSSHVLLTHVSSVSATPLSFSLKPKSQGPRLLQCRLL